MNEGHVVGLVNEYFGRLPGIVEDLAELELVMHADVQQHPIAGVLGQRPAALLLAGLGINIGLGLGHQVKGNGQPHLLGGREGGQKVDALNVSLLGVIPVPADEIIFVGVGLLLNAVIEDQHARRVFEPPDHGFDDAPQVGAGFTRRSQETSDLIVRDFTVDHLRKPGGGGGSKGTDQIIGVEVKHGVVHRSSLLLEPLIA